MRSFSGRVTPRFPCASGDYALLAELGLGVTATVYLALCKTLRRKVAVKLLDLEAIEQAGGLVSALQGLRCMSLHISCACPHAMLWPSCICKSCNSQRTVAYSGWRSWQLCK